MNLCAISFWYETIEDAEGLGGNKRPSTFQFLLPIIGDFFLFWASILLLKCSASAPTRRINSDMSAPLSPRTKVCVSSFGLLCLSLILTAYSARNPWIARSGSYVVSELTTPFQTLFSTIFSFASQSGSTYLELVSARERNKLLIEKLKALEENNARLLEFRFENEQLRSLLAMSREVADEGVGATVIGYDPSGWVKGIVIDKGSREGLTVGLPVVVGVGLVGQTVSVSRTASRVLLITDHASGVDVLVQDSRVRGVSEGSGSVLCDLRYVGAGEGVRIGDRVITSGMDGVYPKGLLVGHIADVSKPVGSMFQSLELRPAVNFDKLEEVFVITAPRTRLTDVDDPAATSKKEDTKR